jgi:hypothetical protein
VFFYSVPFFRLCESPAAVFFYSVRPPKTSIWRSVASGEPDAATHLPPQYDQLMSERGVLPLKSALRLERRGEQSQEEAEQSDHRR